MAASLVLEYFLGRPRILPIIKETIDVFFRMVHKKKLLRRSRFKHRTCSESQYEVIYFVYVVKKIRNRYILCKNCSIHGKDCETSGPYNFHVQKSVKSNTTDVWNWRDILSVTKLAWTIVIINCHRSSKNQK